jgi:hypothetical protein
MTLPGFTAQASLYRTNEHYQLTMSNADLTHNQTVIPQTWRCFRFGECNFLCCLYGVGGELLYCTHYGVPCNISTP